MMTKKPYCCLLNVLFFKYFAVRFFFAAFFLICIQANSQSFFYFGNKLSTGVDSPVTYNAFLTIQSNGSAIARVRYIDPRSGDNRLIELNLLDSGAAQINKNDSNHYLVIDGDPLLISGASDSGFNVPRFVFKKQVDDSGSYYVPADVLYKLADGNWQASEMITAQQKNFNDLRNEMQLVNIFYNEDDDFFKQIFYSGSAPRGTERRKEKMYVIAVANTLDSSIGITTKIDENNVGSMFVQLATDLNMDINVKEILDKNFSKNAVLLALSSIHPKPNDIVIFYYSGHGFRYTNDVSQYPRISLRANKQLDLDKNNLRLEDIYNTLLKKKAKVTLVLSDCCNDDIGAMVPSGNDILTVRGGVSVGAPELNMDACNKLFFPSKPVSIIIGSADKNQLAAGNPKLGGYFTNSFTAELRKTLYEYSDDHSNASWLGILARTKKQASWLSLSALCGTNRCIQTAAFIVNPPQ